MAVGRHGGRSVRRLVTSHFQSETEEGKPGLTVSFLFSLGTAHGVMMPTFREGLPFLANPLPGSTPTDRPKGVTPRQF